MRSKKKLFVHLFQVVPSQGSVPLHDLLNKISKTGLGQRVMDVGYKLRVEDEILAPSKNHPYWLIDFAKLRFDGGPGRASANIPTRSFDLDEDEGFSEETAMLYHPESGRAIIQYNHHGPRVGSISEYLSVFDHKFASSYEFRVQLRSDAQARLRNKKFFTRVEMKVAPAYLSDNFKKKNIALTTMLETQAEDFAGDIVSIEVSLERDRSKSLKMRNWLPSIISLADEDHSGVKHLLIAGRDDEGGRVDEIDLLTEKEELPFTGLEMDNGLRYLRQERYRVLESAFSTWKAGRVIP